jgi:hypothetical protein
VKAGYNTSTIAFQVMQGKKNEIQYLRVYLGYPVTGKHQYTDIVLQVEGQTQG